MIKNAQKLEREIIRFSYLKLAKPTSSFFRGIFEFKKVREIFGILVVSNFFLVNFLPNFFSSVQTFFDVNLTKISPQEIQIKTEKSLQKPLGIFRITKEFSFFHPGIDLATEAGTAILPIMPGKVIKTARQRFGYGNYIMIDHGSGYQSLYAHLVKINVEEGQQVQKDTIIGFIGSTGHSTGPHLHLEISYNHQKINPKNLFEEYFGQKLASSR